MIILLALLQTFGAVCIGIVGMIAACKLLMGMFAVDPSQELHEKNMAIGMVCMGIFIGCGVMMGLIVWGAIR